MGIFCCGHLGQTKKRTYNSLNIGPRGLGCETNIEEIMGWESFGVWSHLTNVVIFDLGPLIQGQTRLAKPKSAVLILEVLV